MNQIDSKYMFVEYVNEKDSGNRSIISIGLLSPVFTDKLKLIQTREKSLA